MRHEDSLRDVQSSLTRWAARKAPLSPRVEPCKSPITTMRWCSPPSNWVAELVGGRLLLVGNLGLGTGEEGHGADETKGSMKSTHANRKSMRSNFLCDTILLTIGTTFQPFQYIPYSNMANRQEWGDIISKFHFACAERASFQRK